MKRFLLIFISLALIVCFASCGGDTKKNSNNAGREVKKLEKAFAEKPILITSAGQSADVQLLSVAMGKVELECEISPLIDARDFDPVSFRTLIFAIGGSSKGLGAAGIDKEEELARCMALVEKAKDKCSIIVVHIGGSARRGTLSDTFINEITPYADYILVLKGADDDGLFTNIAAVNDIPMDTIDVITNCGPRLTEAFLP